MIYGRRLFDKSLEEPFRRKPAMRVFRIVNSAYQWKYTWYFNAFLLFSILIFLGPLWYFQSQNYATFMSLAQKTAPNLLEHLERETMWLLGFSIFSLVALFALTTWVTLRMTSNIIGPLISLERHMWKVTTGDWSSEDFRIRADDDFRELADTYSYMYRSLRAQAASEIKLLERVVVDPSQKDSYNAFMTLMNLKRTQMTREMQTLNLEIPKTSSQNATPGRRHVS